MENKLIISFLGEISKKFNSATFTYLQNPRGTGHFVSVSDPEIYNSEEFSDLELDFSDDFYDNSPLENLTFLVDSELRLFKSLKVIHIFTSIELKWFQVATPSIEFEISSYEEPQLICEDFYSLAA